VILAMTEKEWLAMTERGYKNKSNLRKYEN